MSGSNEGRKSRPSVVVPVCTDFAGKKEDRGEHLSEQVLALLQEVRGMFREILEHLKKKVKDWYTTKEAADQLGLAEFTIRRYARDGRLESLRVSGPGPKGRILLSRASLDAVMQNGGKLSDRAMRAGQDKGEE
jgi:excisionase family DNA binding protein